MSRHGKRRLIKSEERSRLGKYQVTDGKPFKFLRGKFFQTAAELSMRVECKLIAALIKTSTALFPRFLCFMVENVRM